MLSINAVNAVPLNINLGAYSPALVVGDGEISFGAATDVSNLMSTLQSSTPSTGARLAVAATPNEAPGTNSNTAGKEVVPGKGSVPVAAAVSSPSPVLITSTAPASTQEAPVAPPAAPPVAQQPEAQPDPAPTTPKLFSGVGLGPDKKKFILPRDPVTEAEAEPSMEEELQILKHEVASLKEGKPVESVLTARDLAGFQAALNFAAAAMKSSPPIELGTGEKGSGVGIKVGSGASGSVAAAPAKPAKRGLTAIRVISRRSPLETENNDSSSSSSSSSPTIADVDPVNLNLGDEAGAVSVTIMEL